MTLEYADQTRLLRRCFFDVHNEVGLGRQEEGYHQACVICFQQQGVVFQSKPPHRLMIAGEAAYTLIPDFVAWDMITVELKAVPRRLNKSEFVQLFDYLKCRNDRLGLLVNMGLDRVHVERVLYERPQYQCQENWQHWKGLIGGHDRELGREMREALRTIYEAHQTGNGEEVTRELILFELRRRRLSHIIAPVAKAYFQEHEVDEAPLDCLVVEGCVLLVYTALFDSNQFNISRGLSYMRALGLQWGVAANFGRQIAEFTALRAGI